MPKFKTASAPAPEVTDGGTVRGYASTFDRKPDAYGDVIAKGAFERTLGEWAAKGDGVSIPLLYGHNTDDPEYNKHPACDPRKKSRWTTTPCFCRIVRSRTLP